MHPFNMTLKVNKKNDKCKFALSKIINFKNK